MGLFHDNAFTLSHFHFRLISKLRLRFFLQIQVLLFLNRYTNTYNFATLELARRFVFLAHRIAAVITYAKSVAT